MIAARNTLFLVVILGASIPSTGQTGAKAQQQEKIDGTSAASGSQPSTASSFSNTSAELIGLWSGDGEMIEFRPDGNCVYQGNTFPYKVSQGHIILTTTEGNATFSYTVKEGKVLTLTANGQQAVYTKKNS